jgi:hypothetical protein
MSTNCSENINTNCNECSENTPCPEINYTNIGCPQLIDSKCVVYNGEDIECVDVESGDILEHVISKITDAVCNGVTINLAVANTDNTISAIITNPPSGRLLTINSVVSPNANNALVKVSNGLFVPQFTQTSITTTNSQSINFTTSGTANHTITANVRISNVVGNTLSILSDGLFVSNSANTPLNAVDSNSIDFTTSGIANHTVTASVKLSAFSGNALEIRNDGLYVTIPSFTQTPITLVNTNSISGSVSGTNNHTLTLNIRISEQEGNALTLSSSGLFVATPASQTPITTVASSTLTLTASGTNSHTLTGTVRVSASANNAISVNSDGLFVTNQFQPIENQRLSTGNNVTFANITGNGFLNSERSLTNVLGEPYFQSRSRLVSTYNSGSVFGGATVYTNNLIDTLININSNQNVAQSSIWTSQFILTKILPQASTTVTFNGIASKRSYSATQIMHQIDGPASASITDISGIQIHGLYKESSATNMSVTNNYAILINDQFNYNVTNVTNSYAIYQEGVNDISRFFGPVQNAGGTQEFASDERVKENVVEFSKGLDVIDNIQPYRYNYIYNQNKTVTGLIAQELEEFLPEAVTSMSFTIPKTETTINDFKSIDQTTLFYVMLNAIKELSAKVKALENN